ncbi:MAG: hypothetical protein ACK5O3_10020, partial [Burkholderiales bacterium]
MNPNTDAGGDGKPDAKAHAGTESSSAALPAAHWFASSRRLVGGQPDTRYGWWEPDAGGPLIVKALCPELSVAAGSLLLHERQQLQQLARLGAPVPEALEAAMRRFPSCVITRFAGLSLRTLEARAQRGLPALNLHERLSVWAHLARRLSAPAAHHGLLVADLWSGNVLVPLTQQRSGQLQLSRPVLVDHAHTLLPGSGMRRPLWLDEHMLRIAPELALAMRADREALQQHFEAMGASLPGYSHLPGDRDRISREAWLRYDAPSAVQRQLDAGQLSAGAAMQYALGQALAHELMAFGSQAKDLPNPAAVRSVQQRLCALEPRQRYPDLEAAASALAQALGDLAQASAAELPQLAPQDLLLEPELATAGVVAHQAETACPSVQAEEHALAHRAASVHGEPVLGMQGLTPWLWGGALLGAALAGL